jgi:hypothetical protein
VGLLRRFWNRKEKLREFGRFRGGGVREENSKRERRLEKMLRI